MLPPEQKLKELHLSGKLSFPRFAKNNKTLASDMAARLNSS